MLVAIIVGVVLSDGITSTWLLVLCVQDYLGTENSWSHFGKFYNVLAMLGIVDIIVNLVIYCRVSR